MTDNTYDIKINIEPTDDKEAQSAIDLLNKRASELANAFNIAEVSADDFVDTISSGINEKPLRDLAESIVNTDTELDNVLDAFRKLGTNTDVVRELELQFEKLTEQIRNSGKASTQLDFGSNFLAVEDRNDRTRRAAGLIGDVDSSLQTLRGAGDSFGVSSNITGAIGNTGEIFAAVEGISQFSASAKALSASLGETIKQLGAGGAAIAGLGAAIGVLLAITSQLNKNARKQLDPAINAQNEYFALIQTGTSAQIEAKIKELETSIAIEENRLAFAQEASNQIEALYTDTYGFIGNIILEIQEILARFGVDIANGLNAFVEAEKEAEVALTDQTAQLEVYRQALDSTEVAANDAAIAEKQLADARQQTIDASARTFRNFQELLRDDNLSLEQVTQQIEDLNDANAAINATLNSGGEISEEYRKELEEEARLNRLQLRLLQDVAIERAKELDGRKEEARQLEEVQANRLAAIDAQVDREQKLNDLVANASVESLNSRIEAIEQEKQALENALPLLKEQAKTNEDAQTRLDEYTSKIAALNSELDDIGNIGAPAALGRALDSFNSDIAAIRNESAQAIASITADLNDRIQQIESRYSEQVSRANATLANATNRANSQLADRLESANSEFNDRIIEAESEATKDRTDAIRNNQLEFIALEQDILEARQDVIKKGTRSIEDALGDRDALQLFQAKQTTKDELAEIQERQTTREQELENSLARELEAIQTNLNERRQEANKFFTDSVNEARNAYNQQIQEARNAYNQQIQEARNAYNQQIQEARSNAANQIALEREKEAQLIAERTNSYNQQIASLQSFANQSVNELNNFSNSGVNTIASFVNKGLSELNRLRNETIRQAEQQAKINNVNVNTQMNVASNSSNMNTRTVNDLINNSVGRLVTRTIGLLE